MWLKLDDNLVDHPKFFIAGRYLGKRGRMRAFVIYIAGLSWSNRHISDGFIPIEAVRGFAIDENPTEVARVLALKSVELWHKTTSGFRIHDYHDHNPKSAEIKEKRKRDRDRKREERGGLKRGNHVLSNGLSEVCPSGQFADSAWIPDGVRTDSRALARARSGSGSRSPKDTSTGAGAPAFGHRREPDIPTHAQLCLLATEARALYPDAAEADLKEAMKLRCVQLRLEYSHDHGAALQRALDASAVMAAKRSA